MHRERGGGSHLRTREEGEAAEREREDGEMWQCWIRSTPVWSKCCRLLGESVGLRVCVCVCERESKGWKIYI